MVKKIPKNINKDTWLTVDSVCELLDIKPKTLKEQCRKGTYIYKIVQEGKKYMYMIQAKSLPLNIQEEFNIEEESIDEFNNAPEWAKIQADKYIRIIKATKHLKGKELTQAILEWNKNNPSMATSYWSVLRMRRKYKSFGICGLLAQYGKNVDKSKITPKYLEYFKSLYLDQDAPSLYSCWENTLGYAIRTSHIKKSDFPSYSTFIRKLKIDIPEQAIYLARYGESAYNMKYGGYINRDYSNIHCGEVWVSDHAQIDVAVFDKDGKVCFPWVTVWRDYKSGKWLGWLLECGSPNSDRIFQAFYYAVQEFGLPKDIIIDNGKDYRCYDFAGGRPQRTNNIKVESDINRTTSMLDALNVQVHFALPYNAQTKPVERDFLKIKHLLSKHCVGYRGGNVVERPEKLIDEIKNKELMPFYEFKKLFNDFIINIYNKKPSSGKNLKGISPDKLYFNDCQESLAPSIEALKLFCMRSSKIYTIGRNGIIDRQLEITYWADWLVSKTKTKIYLRRDPKNYKEAWVFRADNDEFLGKVKAVEAVAALHAEEVSKEEFKEALSIKKRNKKLTQEYISNLQKIPFSERCENYKAICDNDVIAKKPKVTRIANTPMDKVIRKNKEMEAFGKNDLTMFMPKTEPKEEDLYLFETDRLLEEELKGVANGGY